METNPPAPGYKIWAVDNVVYGPVELPMLVCWVKDERVTRDTWVFDEQKDSWQKAAQLPELKMFFRGKASDAAPAVESAAGLGIRPGTLRRVKILADLSEEQLARFAGFMEAQSVRQWTEIVRQGQPGDAMYLVLDGELRVRLMINGKESILATLGAGEFFGEMALFDSGARSADVIANKDSTLLKVSSAVFERVLKEAPELAAGFLHGVGRTLAARIRADNKRFKDSVSFARSAGI